MTNKALILGATGMVGYQVLTELSINPDVSNIISIGRRSTGFKSSKLVEVEHTNFLNYDALSHLMSDIDVCLFCLAAYQGVVPANEFQTITCDYLRALTNALEKTSPNCRFVLFSAKGADTTEKSKVLYARFKGMAENQLNKTVFPRKYIFRPGYIHPTGNRLPPRLSYRLISRWLGTSLLCLFPKTGSTDNELAHMMVETGAIGDKPSAVFESADIRQFFKSRRTGSTLRAC